MGTKVKVTIFFNGLYRIEGKLIQSAEYKLKKLILHNYTKGGSGRDLSFVYIRSLLGI